MKIGGQIITMCVLLFASTLLTGCATTVDLSKFHDADLKEAEIMPGKDQLNQQRIKIVVFEADEGRLPHAVNAHLGESLAKAVEKELMAVGAEVVDRNLASKLKDELRLTESVGAGSYAGPQVAQYAIRGKVNSAEYNATYIEASTWKDDKGETHINPARYDHKATVGGSISLYELPSLRLVDAINVAGSTSASDPLMKANWATGSSLLRSATSAAIDGQYELKNFFAPRGYVVERRVDGKKSIFKILMGKGQGVHQEDKVVIYSLRKKTNALTGAEQTDERPVIKAKVSDQIENGACWIVPDDQDASAQVKLGDFVKVKYESNSIF
jgi:hypothetical protein